MTGIITHNEIVGSNTYSVSHYLDSRECHDLVKESCDRFWVTPHKGYSRENYEFGPNAKPWSLGPMLKENKFEYGYTVLCINDQPWAFGGVKKYDDETAIILARHFSFYSFKSITRAFLMPMHFRVAKEFGLKKAWITLNDYNMRMSIFLDSKSWNRKLTVKDTLREYSEVSGGDSVNLGKKVINNIEQIVLEWKL